MPHKQQPSQVGRFLGFLPQRATRLHGRPQPRRQIFLPSANSIALLNSDHCFHFLFGRNSLKHNHTCASFPFFVIASRCSFLAFNMTWTLGWLQTHWIPNIPSSANTPRLRFTYTQGHWAHIAIVVFNVSRQKQRFRQPAQIPFRRRASHSLPW